MYKLYRVTNISSIRFSSEPQFITKYHQVMLFNVFSARARHVIKQQKRKKRNLKIGKLRW
jgi:hypothetical protein